MPGGSPGSGELAESCRLLRFMVRREAMRAEALEEPGHLAWGGGPGWGAQHMARASRASEAQPPQTTEAEGRCLCSICVNDRVNE